MYAKVNEYKQILQQKNCGATHVFIFWWFDHRSQYCRLSYFREGFGFYYQTANVISWIASVLFAYFTNKLWVFEAKQKRSKSLGRHLESSFFALYH